MKPKLVFQPDTEVLINVEGQILKVRILHGRVTLVKGRDDAIVCYKADNGLEFDDSQIIDSAHALDS